MIGTVALVAALSGVASWLIAGRVRQDALHRSLLDVPNQRSSHSVPTPRGGGLGIAVVTLAGTALAAAGGLVPIRLAAAIVGGGALIAGVGFVDDRRGLPASTRALAHTLAALWAVWWLGGLPDLDVGAGTVHLGRWGGALAVAGIVWATNLYNFMDGIDGLAGGEATLVGSCAGVLLMASGRADLALVAWLVSAASAGFLVWNWAPAKLFMGDVGSGLLGYLFATLAVASENAGALPLLAWVILTAVFVVDATITLVRRALRGERWYAAHRSHAYQRAVQLGRGHAWVTTSVLLLDLALCALAAVAWRWHPLLLPALGASIVLVGLVYVVVERQCPMYPLSQPHRAAPPR
ncbi:MAG TPA: glycosyltransferase family 4 protein [Gemmatimonadaceae bacterium]|nr:glycosyltransferase family 4 protein [Gemmatimonadaceae bacterium]